MNDSVISARHPYQRHIDAASQVTDWLLAGLSKRHRLAPELASDRILHRLAQAYLRAQGIDPAAISGPISQPYVLETAVCLLRQTGAWPDDPEMALVCQAEILTVILETAPAYEVPWEAITAAANAGLEDLSIC